MDSTQTPKPAKDRSAMAQSAQQSSDMHQHVELAKLILVHAESLERQMHAWAADYYALEIEKNKKCARFKRFLRCQLETATIFADLQPDVVEQLGEECSKLIDTIQIVRDEIIPPAIQLLETQVVVGATVDKQQESYLQGTERLRADIDAFRDRSVNLQRQSESGN